MTKRTMVAAVVAATLALLAPMALAAVNGGPPGSSEVNDLSMATAEDGWSVDPIFTVGETVGDYTPPGVIDGLGAYEYDDDTVRVLANHEILNSRGYDYTLNTGTADEFTMKGARISYFDIDKDSRRVVGSGLAYDTVYDHLGNVATDTSFLPEPYAPRFGGGPGDGVELQGFSRFCSGSLFEAHQFGNGRGLEDRIYFAGEEDGGGFSSVGGNEWAVDLETGSIWALPDLGRGAWENVTVIDTGRRNTVAVLLADDTEPFDADGDGEVEAAPLFLYVGKKDPGGDFPAQNGLRGGDLYVFVSNNGVTTPADFNTSGKLRGRWVEIDNSPSGTPSQDGSSGFDEYGYPTQSTLWARAEALGSFGFSRPEDIATNPTRGQGNEAVLASTGVDSYVGGADSFGTIYTIETGFSDLSAVVEIIYDGDADPDRTVRSPDNLDWADDRLIYVQEDEAEEDTLAGEPLFGEGAANPNEAGIISMNSQGRDLRRVATINRGVPLDASLDNPTMAFDVDYGNAGEWESSGILDVSTLFGERRGTLFLFDVQAHGIEDQTDVIEASRINDGDLVEGGQLLFLEKD